MAAPTCVLTVIKSFTYRGIANEEWSNTYMLSGAAPADTAAWRTLFDQLTAQEVSCYTSDHKVVGGYGYDKVPGPGDHAVWSVDLNVSPNTPKPGTLVLGSGVKFAGDQAAWIRFGLNRYNTHGKRVYLRKYLHGGAVASGGGDALLPLYMTNLTNYGDWLRGTPAQGQRTLLDKTGAAPIGTGVSSFVTTRTLKRRGKRPPT